MKRFRLGTERAVDPAQTFERARRLMRRFGITRIATTTHLDRIGIPVVAACRPNSRSLAVSQGKGLTLEAARASALMESIECHHAEHILAPLVLASHRNLCREQIVADIRGLPRVNSGCFDEDRPILWIAGVDLLSRRRIFVPYEVVHLDFRLPLPPASGGFLMSSNGLASGNQLGEAISHAICELVERDANTLLHMSDCAKHGPAHRIDAGSIDDESCRVALDRFEQADVAVAIWDTTTDIGIPSFLCSAVDRDSKMPL
ncbi:MAG TPA: YcaO-like family protein, partial [Polyangiaceae bacterium]|nr:YcaO-like family protein [Polyangiaceae bacterium]